MNFLSEESYESFIRWHVMRVIGKAKDINAMVKRFNKLIEKMLKKSAKDTKKDYPYDTTTFYAEGYLFRKTLKIGKKEQKT